MPEDLRSMFPVKTSHISITYRVYRCTCSLSIKTCMGIISIKIYNLWRTGRLRARWGYIRGFDCVCTIFYILKIPKPVWQNEQMVDT